MVVNLYVTGETLDFSSDNETEPDSIDADPDEGMSEYAVSDDDTSMFCIRFCVVCFALGFQQLLCGVFVS